MTVVVEIYAVTIDSLTLSNSTDSRLLDPPRRGQTESFTLPSLLVAKDNITRKSTILLQIQFENFKGEFIGCDL